MNEELTYEGVAEMKKADYFKAVKDKALWKKAEAILLLHKYKLNGALVPVVALPLRKKKQMKEMLKVIRADKRKEKPNLKQVYIAEFKLQKDEKTGKTIACVHTPLIGKAAMAEIFEKKGKALFEKLNYHLVVEANADSESKGTFNNEETVSIETTMPKPPSKKISPEQEAKVREGAQIMHQKLRAIMNKMGVS